MKKASVVLLAVLATGCAHQASVSSTSAAYEIRTDKVRAGKAYVVVARDLEVLEPTVKSGYVCGAHSYPLQAGPAVKSSIMKTMEAAYKEVVSVPSRNEAQKDGHVYVFALDEFSPKLRFTPGFFSATADASVEMAMRTSAVAPDGKDLVSTTVRGYGAETTDGECPVGADILAKATQKAIRVTLENFVTRVINSDLVK